MSRKILHKILKQELFFSSSYPITLKEEKEGSTRTHTHVCVRVLVGVCVCVHVCFYPKMNIPFNFSSGEIPNY